MEEKIQKFFDISAVFEKKSGLFDFSWYNRMN